MRYPGLTSGLWHQMRYASLAEDRTLWQYLGYHLTFLQKLTYDPASGTYNFATRPRTAWMASSWAASPSTAASSRRPRTAASCPTRNSSTAAACP